MMPHGKHTEGELVKTKEKRKKKKKCGPEPKNKSEKGLCNPTSATSSLRETYSCVCAVWHNKWQKEAELERGAAPGPAL